MLLAPQADLSNKDSVDELAQIVSSKIDVLVNNAGILTKSSALEGALQSYWPAPRQNANDLIGSRWIDGCECRMSHSGHERLQNCPLNTCTYYLRKLNLSALNAEMCFNMFNLKVG